MLKWFACILILGLLLVAGAGLWAWQDFQSWQQQPLEFSGTATSQQDPPQQAGPDTPDGRVLFLPRGTSFRGMLGELSQLGVAVEPWRWRLLARMKGDRIQAGEYRIDDTITPVGLLDKLRSGEVVRYGFTIVEGWSVDQLLRQLQTPQALEQTLSEELVTAIEQGRGLQPAVPAMQELMALLGSDHEHAEGWFLPETYFYVRGDRDVDLLRRAHQAMQQALEEAWDKRHEDLPLEEPGELLTLASIVEKETGLPDERDAVAGVFIRRLQKNMLLQTDPTVIYGIGARYDGDIRTRDLREDTPYNTYVHAGLPPTPIALPSRASLMASARPADGTALYFVATGDGGHVFADTLAEHNRNVRAYLRRQRQGR